MTVPMDDSMPMPDAWIRVVEAETPPVGERPVYLLRREFSAPGDLADAWLRITAQGLYTAFINGERVGVDELTPGYTQYNKRIQVQTYDVMPMLRGGRNAIVVQLADGWFRGSVGIHQQPNHYGDAVALLAELALQTTTGDASIFATDAQWRVAPSHILGADLMRGQHEDRRRFDPTVYLPGYDDSGWTLPAAHTVTARLVAPIAPPVRQIETLRPKTIRELREGVHVVDFGQNINGWVRLRGLGPAGNRITLTHGEALDHRGDVTIDHLSVNIPVIPDPIPCRQIDTVISAGIDGDVFEPHFTIKGFQYVRVEGLPGVLDFDDIEAVAVHSDLRRIGGFSTSDPRLTWLHDAAEWSFRGNACEVPTDCPTRERSGWTGDWQLFAPTAAYLYDVDTFTRKWLADVLLDQREDGAIANISPLEHDAWTGPMAFLNASSGWGDVISAAPHALFWAYGSTAAIDQCWDGMTKWLGFAERAAREGRNPERTGDPLPHEQYLWDTGFHWGEWLEPGNEVDDFGAFLSADKSEVATAFLFRSAAQMAEMGRVIGRPNAEVQRLEELAAHVRDAWQREFIDAAGRLRVRTQASHVRALHFGLAPEHQQARIAADLVELIREAGMHLGTGFLSTPYLLPVLADHGYTDVAYALLLQDTEPSWMYMRSKGATTMWERWNGIDAGGVPHESLNHYSKGAVISFLHHYVAGLRAVEPGYRRFVVAPVLGGGVHDAATHQLSPFGEIRVSWHLRDGRFAVDVSTPLACAGELRLPDGTTFALASGETQRFNCVMT